MKEQIYIDHNRLDHYVEQIGSPFTSDKYPIWSVDLSLVGPKATGQQQRPVRPLTTFEKLKLLVTHLRQNGLVTDGSPLSALDTDTSGFDKFRIHSLLATRLHLPPKKTGDSNFKGIRLWIGHFEKLNVTGRLILMEDYRGTDQSGEYISAYSDFLLFTGIFEPVLRKTELGDELVLPKYESAFLTKPIETLNRLGATIVTQREVSILYRVRSATGPANLSELSYDTVKFTTIGYPIAVYEGANAFDFSS